MDKPSLKGKPDIEPEVKPEVNQEDKKKKYKEVKCLKCGKTIQAKRNTRMFFDEIVK